MAATAVNDMPPGEPMPDFSLEDVRTGQFVQSGDVVGPQGTLVVFLCRHCPYVVHIRPTLVALAGGIAGKGINTVAVSSNDPVTYPDDAPGKLREMAAEWTFPLLFDASQEVARRFRAVCTPDIYLYDAARRLYYRGRMDASTPGNGLPSTGNELQAAIESLLAGRPAPSPQHPAIGCSIKWKKN